MAKEEERMMRFQVEGQNGNDDALFDVDAVFSDDGRLTEFWIEAVDDDATTIDAELCSRVIQMAITWRKVAIKQEATVIEEEKTKPAEDDAQSSLPF
jgi:Mor family transcriptional regulator